MPPISATLCLPGFPHPRQNGGGEPKGFPWLLEEQRLKSSAPSPLPPGSGGSSVPTPGSSTPPHLTLTPARLGFGEEEKEPAPPSPQGQSHTQPQARLLLPEPMSYYREISFPVCASSQGLPVPFTFTFSPISPSLLLSVVGQLEIPLSSPLPIPAPGWRG